MAIKWDDTVKRYRGADGQFKSAVQFADSLFAEMSFKVPAGVGGKTQIAALRVEGRAPCGEARLFCEGFETFEEAWKVCPDSDWMAWYGEAVGANLLELAEFCAARAEDYVDAHFWETYKNSMGWAVVAVIAERASATKAEACQLIREFWPVPPAARP